MEIVLKMLVRNSSWSSKMFQEVSFCEFDLKRLTLFLWESKTKMLVRFMSTRVPFFPRYSLDLFWANELKIAAVIHDTRC